MKNIWRRAIAFATSAAVIASACGSYVQAAQTEQKIAKPVYQVTVEDSVHGKLLLNRAEGFYEKEELVEVAVHPEEGYRLEEIKVAAKEKTTEETEIPVEQMEDGIRFPMPAKEIVVCGSFVPEETEVQADPEKEGPVETEPDAKEQAGAETKAEPKEESETPLEPKAETETAVKLKEPETAAETKAETETVKSGSETEQEVPDGIQTDFTKTFRVKTSGGILRILDLEGKLLAELKEGQEKTFSYADGSDAPKEVRIEAIAEDGFLVSSYVTKWFVGENEYEIPDSFYNIQEKEYKRGHFLASAEMAEVFEVSFSGPAAAESAVKTAAAIPRAAGDPDDPQVGDIFTGNASVVYDGHPNIAYNGTGYIVCKDGAFKGDSITMSTCASGHDFAAPQTGQTGTYTITITNVDAERGLVACTVYWENQSSSSGYQNLSSTYTYRYNPLGGLLVFKEMADSLGAFIYPYKFLENLDLSASFGVYTDSKCTNKVAAVKTDKNGDPVKEELELAPGNYFIKETKPPKNFALNETIKSIKIGSGASKSVTIKDRVFRTKVNGYKIDANTGTPTPTPGLSLAGAEYTVYGDKECTKGIATGRTNEQGKIEFERIYFACGIYFIKETIPPRGYQLDPKVYKISINEELGFYPGSDYRLNDVTFTSADIPEDGKAKIKKVSANPSISAGNSCYSLEGAEFKLTNIETGVEVAERLVTKADGESQEITLPAGPYLVEEVKAPKGFWLSTEKIPLEVVNGETAVCTYKNKPANDPVGVLLKKIDQETGKPVATGTGTFENAEYTFKYYDGQYNAEAELNGVTPTRTWVLATDIDGLIWLEAAKKISGDDFYLNDGQRVLPLGTVTVQESKAPNGYQLNPTLYIQNIDANFNGGLIKTYQAPDSPEPPIRGGVQIEKHDIELNDQVPQGSASLAEATFDIYNRSANPVTVKGTLFQKDEVVYTFKTDASGTAKTANDLLQYGDYEIIERDAPAGYLPAGKLQQSFRIREQGKLVELAGDQAIKNEPIRGDLKGIKVSDGDQKRMAGVPFQITSVTTGENHVVITDENGMFSTASDWVPHSQNTNRGETAEDGIWFGAIEALDDTKGALLYDTYRIEELPCEANADKVLLKPFEVVVKKNLVVIDLGTITNDYKPKPEIGTTAKDQSTGSNTGYISQKTTITDTVEYVNLTPGVEKLLKGVLMDQETGKPFLDNNKEVWAEKTFTSEKASGTVEITFTFDSSALAGKKVVVFEYLYEQGKEIAVHTDLKDQDQTVAYLAPEVGTKAADIETGSDMGYTSEKTTIVDTVAYKGLIPGLEHLVKGVVMDQETKKPLLVDGKEIRAEKTFTPEKPNGSIELAFTFNSSALAGKKVVVFEYLYEQEREIAVHTDIKDQDQTVTFQEPGVSTTAKDQASGTHTGQPGKTTILVDTVDYKGLIPGIEHLVKGVVMDKETKKPLMIDGKEIRAEKTFTPDKPNGTVELAFTFDSSALAGKEVVVFEHLYSNDREIAVHADITDQNQTVKYEEPKKETMDFEIAKLADKTTGASFNEKTGRYEGTKTPGTYQPGDKVSWKILVTNTGNAAIKGLTVEDTLSQALSESLESVGFDCTDGAVLKTAGGREVKIKVESALKVVLDQLEPKDRIELTVKGTLKKTVPVYDTALENKVTGTAGDLTKTDKDAIKIPKPGEKGTTPVSPSTPASTASTKTSPPKTGDDTPIAFYVGLAGAALAGIVLAWKKRKRKAARQ